MGDLQVEDDGYVRENIFLFVPNLIGYLRVVLALGSLYYMPIHPRSCAGLYVVSCLLDALDGAAARKFNQSTRFGAVLDMITDRCTTACLLVFLASAFPSWSILFQGLISLDVASHYTYLYAVLSLGQRSHKKVEGTGILASILRLYYEDQRVLFTLCAADQLFFISLYLLSFSSPYLSPLTSSGELERAKRALAPGSAAAMELARANKMDSTVPWILAAISFPAMFLKQFINVVQFVQASNWLADADRKIRIKEGLVKQRKKTKKTK